MNLDGFSIQINNDLITAESWALLDYGDVSYLEIFGDGFVLRKKVTKQETRESIAEKLGLPN